MYHYVIVQPWKFGNRVLVYYIYPRIFAELFSGDEALFGVAASVEPLSRQAVA